MLAHNVYFALHDNSPAARARLITACNRYLTGHHGTLFFACGTLAEELKRDVNVRDFDVALHLVFTDQAAHDAYQVAFSHERFIEENKSNWKAVRVFDSVVEGPVKIVFHPEKEEARRPYVTSIERMAKEDGRMEGMQIGREVMLNVLEPMLEIKFGAAGLALMPELHAITDLDVLSTICKAVKTANSVDELRRIWTK